MLLSYSIHTYKIKQKKNQEKTTRPDIFLRQIGFTADVCANQNENFYGHLVSLLLLLF